MEKFTKIEISWMSVEFAKLAKEFEQEAKETPDKEFARMYQMRFEQYTDISRRLRLALQKLGKQESYD